MLIRCKSYLIVHPAVLSPGSEGHSGELSSQWEAVYFRDESHVSVGHQAAEDQPGGGPQPCCICGYQGHQVRLDDTHG